MNPVNFGKNTFCGPSVLSAVLGIDTDTAEGLIKSVTGQKRDVTWTKVTDLEKAFQLAGCKTEVKSIKATTVFGNMFHIREDGYYIFTVPNHFIAIEVNGNHRYICDNHSKEPVRASSSARLSQTVKHIFKVTKLSYEDSTTNSR